LKINPFKEKKMPGHDVLAHLGGVAGEFPDIVDLDDVTASKTLDLKGAGIARVSVTATATVTLPDAGFMVFIIGNGATATVQDGASSMTMEVIDGECGLVTRASATKWVGVVLKPSAT